MNQSNTISQLKKVSGGSVRSKIIGLVAVASLLPMAISLVVTKKSTTDVTNTVNHHLTQNIEERITALNRIILDLARVSDETAKPRVANGIMLCKDFFRSQGGLTFSNETVTWTAINQFSKEAKEVRLPKMVVGGRWFGQVKDMNERVMIVDQVKELTGGACSIFQRINAEGDMLRVASNVKTKDGTRAIGTYIPAIQPDGTKNPVVESVLNKKTFTGRAFVVNAWYATSYDPIYGPNGQVVGLTSFGIPQDESNDVRKSILTKRIGDGGYVAIIGGSGAQKGHYLISKDGKRDGEDISGAKDTAGRFERHDGPRHDGDYQGDHAKIKDAVNSGGGNPDQSSSRSPWAPGADQIASASGQIGTGAQSLAQGTSRAGVQPGKSRQQSSRNDRHDPPKLRQRQRSPRHRRSHQNIRRKRRGQHATPLRRHGLD
jgi:hypothetical protein